MTIPTKEISKRELLFRLRRRAKRWQFGIEVGTHSGYEHYQIRYECSNGDYEDERRYWQGIKCELQQGGGWSNYECKDGYFYQSLDDNLGKFRFGQLKGLQLAILSHGRTNGDRQIIAVVDHVGGIGKTFLARWMCLNGYGIYINGTGNENEIIASVYDHTNDGQRYNLFIDLTRNQNQNRSDLWSAIEGIKNGYVEDKRYNHRYRWIYPPKIWVFCNKEPDWGKLSKDRWDKIFINKDEDNNITMWDRNKEGEARSRVFKSRNN